MAAIPTDPVASARSILRRKLLAERETFMAQSAVAVPAGGALAQRLCSVLADLEPEMLGLYWPYRFEFNAAAAVGADDFLSQLPLALPFAQRTPRCMDYRAWDGATPSSQDECGIPSAAGPVVVPDVVVVPCVGYTEDGYRLGYGGGYFDRWLALHPETTTVGVAWSFMKLSSADFQAQAHDRPMTLIVTERSIN